MFQNMFFGLEDGGLWNGGIGLDVWQSMLVDEYVKMIVLIGGIGLVDSIECELFVLQEGL